MHISESLFVPLNNTTNIQCPCDPNIIYNSFKTLRKLFYQTTFNLTDMEVV